mmetsp:Transcript_52687/g.150897  ORF Transcript_52687/g.150897 Transcript_52687/m.150897 type:complete len:157 (+) Transcript_52687:3-473(+)
MLSHRGVVAWKATVQGDERREIAGIAIALATKAAMQKFLGAGTLDGLRKEIGAPMGIAFDGPDSRRLSYVHSFGIVSELRRRGVATELLRRTLEDVQGRAAERGEQGLKAMALHVPAYNGPAIRSYEHSGFVWVGTIAGFYGGCSGYLYAWYPLEA